MWLRCLGSWGRVGAIAWRGGRRWAVLGMAGVVCCVGVVAWRGSRWWAVLGVAEVGHGGWSLARLVWVG